MLSDEVIEKVTERIVNRIEQVNSFILEKIGKDIKKIGTLSPTDAQRLAQVLKYGGDYNKIVQKLAKITELNVKDLYKIFNEVAKSDYQFKKEFYEYRNKMFIPYEDNIALQNQVNALANITAREYVNLTRTTAIGFSVRDRFGNLVFKDLSQAYIDTLDTAVLAISQGKSTFQQEMYRTIKELGESGIKTIDYASGRSVRLDSAIRTSLRSGLRDIRNELQLFYGEEYGANMVEVSHHPNSAPDHIDTVDGKQFALIDEIRKQIANGTETQIKLEDIQGNRVKVKGKWYYDYNYINNQLERKVSTLNCYHYIFNGILGVTKPLFTKEQLEEDKKKNEKGFTYQGKHYSLYEAEQRQRQLELELRKAKDTQIIAKNSGNMELLDKSQKKIRELTQVYRDFTKQGNLTSKLDRARVSGYKRIAIKK